MVYTFISVILLVLLKSWPIVEATIPAARITTSSDKYCISSCRTKSTANNWCWTWFDSNKLHDNHWDYCSPSPGLDYRGNKCVTSCDYHEGTDYKWCRIPSGSWGYCGETVQPSLREYNNYGEECVNPCRFYAPKYSQCQNEKGDWTYCSMFPGLGANLDKCTGPCDFGGYTYKWCWTKEEGAADRWQHCSSTPERRLASISNNANNQCVREDVVDRGNQRRIRFLVGVGQRVPFHGTSSRMITEARTLIRQFRATAYHISNGNAVWTIPGARTIVRSSNLRLDNQEDNYQIGGVPYITLAIQINTARPQGGTTDIAEVIIPREIAERNPNDVMWCLMESLMTAQLVRVEIQRL